MSTTEYQDRVTSVRWQREVANETIIGRGVIVAEFFDEGCSRRLSWLDRPAAAALLAEARDPSRTFDAVVVGEYERAFYGDQFRSVLAVLNEQGMQVWLPESGGPIDVDRPDAPGADVDVGIAVPTGGNPGAASDVGSDARTNLCTGPVSRRRPPYGYRLPDAGEHPNRAHARWGRRLHRLEPDPATALCVRWIFEQRATGRSGAGIARELNQRGVPCPSAADQLRNPHRSGRAWIVRTVVGILENPRYTGRQVWNRHGGTLGRGSRPGDATRWTSVDEWAVSERITHPPLVDDATFVAIQGMRVARKTRDGATRTYVLDAVNGG